MDSRRPRLNVCYNARMIYKGTYREPPTDEDIERWKTLRAQGLTYATIAQRAGLSLQTIRRYVCAPRGQSQPIAPRGYMRAAKANGLRRRGY